MQFMLKLSLRTLLSPYIITRRFDKKIRQPEGLAGGPGMLWISGATFGAVFGKNPTSSVRVSDGTETAALNRLFERYRKISAGRNLSHD